MRMNGRLLLAFFVLFITSCSHRINENIIFKSAGEIDIIPQVSELEVLDGYFKLDQETVILTYPTSKITASLLQEAIRESSNFTPEIVIINNTDQSLKYTSYIFLNSMIKTANQEGYILSIDKHKVEINGKTNAAKGHAIQTLKQLFVPEFFAKEKRDQWFLPCLKISDAPKFSHRGMLLDCARHFFEKTTVKKYIDLLAFYKMNVLHWHLTEDQGWRIEIDAFPQLTEVGAWRIEANGERYGGFYTKDDIREIVKYAADRNITIIPEIELPGHAQAAIASYPHLSCTGDSVDVVNDWGVFKEIYCAGNDTVFDFLETVLTEVMELFPSQYIHIGGDEAPKFRWEHCDKCQKRIANESLKDEHELQSYFIHRIEKFLNKNGRKIIGWDEILEGGLSPTATVQSWRGFDGGITAANANQYAIMSPTSHCYFDYDLKSIDLKKVYTFNPIPADLAKDKHQFILGSECNLWSEHIPDEKALDAKVFPRMLAIAEVLWTDLAQQNYADFQSRLSTHYHYLKYFNVAYGLEGLPGKISINIEEGIVHISGEPGNDEISMEYKWGKNSAFTELTKEISLTQSDTLFIQPYKNKEKYGTLIQYVFAYHSGIGTTINYTTEFAEQYHAGGKTALVDGKLGSADFKDENWQGFWETGFATIMEFKDLTKISHFSTHFYQYSNSWIFMPEELMITGSKDGVKYFPIGTIKAKTNPKERGKIIEEFKLDFDPIELKTLKITAKHLKKVPDWHEAAGAGTWLFTDELIVK